MAFVVDFVHHNENFLNERRFSQICGDRRTHRENTQFSKNGQGLFRLLQGIIMEIQQDQKDICTPQQVRHPGVEIIPGDGWGIHKLELDVLIRRHPRSGFPGGMRELRHFRSGISQSATSADLPVLGGPITMICAAPSFSIM